MSMFFDLHLYFFFILITVIEFFFIIIITNFAYFKAELFH